ncbi:MAG: DUF6929 family protein [Microvirga sp.]
MTLAYTEVRKLTLDPSTHPRSRHFLTAASGLVRIGRRHYVIADDEQHLGVFDPASPGPVQLVRLFDGDLPESAKKRKKKKADLESLVHLPPLPRCPGGALLTLGSGSRPNRRRGALLGLDAAGALLGQVKVIDLASLYEPLGRRFDEVNIEGAMILDDDLMLLQRGNKGGPNATVRYAWRALAPWLLGDVDAAPEPRAVREIDLGAVDGIPFGFTDCAAMPEGGGWLFSAVAEDTDNAFDDGACAGVAIGVVNADGGVQAILPLEPRRKVEGIEARLLQGKVVIGMVTDADDPDAPAEYGTAILKT